MKFSRAGFLKLSTLAVPAIATSGFSPVTEKSGSFADQTLKLGLASYTLRKYSLDDTIVIAKKLELKSIALKSMHMPLESSAEDLKAIAEKVRAAGLDLYGAGVIYMKSKEEVVKAFEYAKNAGIPTIVGVPNHDLLAFVDEQVKSSGIRVAIHNHGPGDDLYSSPADVFEKIKNFDPRIGLCIDIGHVQRIGQQPAAMIEKYSKRLFDIHMKDVSSNDARGTPVEIGRGTIDIPLVLKTLKKVGYKHIIAIEYEKDEQEPVPGLAGSTGYLRGVLKMI